MEEYGGLCHLGLTQVLVCTGKHEVCDAESENLVCLLEHLFCNRIIVIQVFAHSDELGTLSWEYKCFHAIVVIWFYRFQYAKLRHFRQSAKSNRMSD